jgi:hypothetical protein
MAFQERMADYARSSLFIHRFIRYLRLELSLDHGGGGGFASSYWVAATAELDRAWRMAYYGAF